jgi:diketogulonate reductase-like aldo/keto reductase
VVPGAPWSNVVACFAEVHRAIELGIDFLDTADVYGPSPTRTCGAPTRRHPEGPPPGDRHPEAAMRNVNP